MAPADYNMLSIGVNEINEIAGAKNKTLTWIKKNQDSIAAIFMAVLMVLKIIEASLKAGL